uniref:Uncharacterized protein n=1 Tax=Chelonoidis abingdonii TaxID=106734 RepID=A0A8C0H3N2_CHEAB
HSLPISLLLLYLMEVLVPVAPRRHIASAHLIMCFLLSENDNYFFLFLSPSFSADGAFGRCQRVPVIDVYKYEISPPILQHLRIILEKLSHRGTNWTNRTNYNSSSGRNVCVSIVMTVLPG